MDPHERVTCSQAAVLQKLPSYNLVILTMVKRSGGLMLADSMGGWVMFTPTHHPQAGSLGLLSSCLSTWGTARVSSGNSDLLWHCEGQLGIPRALLQG